MPIKKENRKRYPGNWRAISDRIRFVRAGGRCECVGECIGEHGSTPPSMRCGAIHGRRIVGNAKGAKVVLTVAHLDHTPENCKDENLRAMCQACHLRYDKEEHAASRLRSRKGGE